MRMYNKRYLKSILFFIDRAYKCSLEDILELAMLLQRTMIQSFIDEK